MYVCVQEGSLLCDNHIVVIYYLIGGLIDEKEYGLLVTSLEEKMKRLWHSPPTIPSFAPETLLENLSWVYGNDQILDFVKVRQTYISRLFLMQWSRRILKSLCCYS